MFECSLPAMTQLGKCLPATRPLIHSSHWLAAVLVSFARPTRRQLRETEILLCRRISTLRHNLEDSVDVLGCHRELHRPVCVAPFLLKHVVDANGVERAVSVPIRGPLAADVKATEIEVV